MSQVRTLTSCVPEGCAYTVGFCPPKPCRSRASTGLVALSSPTSYIIGTNITSSRAALEPWRHPGMCAAWSGGQGVRAKAGHGRSQGVWAVPRGTSGLSKAAVSRWGAPEESKPRGMVTVLAVTEGDKAGALLQLEMLGEEGAGEEVVMDDDFRADFLGDGDLQAVVQDIAVIERQSEAVAQQLTEHARVMAEASRRLRSRAQVTRLEAAKLKKVARAQQAEALRRREEMRANRTRLEEEARRQQQQQDQLVRQQLEQERQLRQLRLLQQQQQEQEQEQDRNEVLNAFGPQSLVDEAAQAKQQEVEEAGAQGHEKNGTVVSQASPLGAAVMPFEFPNGRHSGNGLDSALTHAPTLDGLDGLMPPAKANNHDPNAKPGVGHGNGAASNSAPPVSAEAAADAAEVGGAVSMQIGVSEGMNVTESLECMIAHPGAMSCTKTVVKKDSETRVAVVSMETTVQCTGDGCLVDSLDVDDFAALAMSTLADTAQELKHSRRFQGTPDADPRLQERRQDIVELLQRGDVVECTAMEPPSKFGHESFIVTLKNQHNGHQIQGMFKPRVDGDAEGWHRAPVEWVAYELNLLLGMDYVPPVAYRTGGVDLGQGRSYKEGAFIYWVPTAKELRKVPATNWGVSVARLLSDTRILDILLNNSDRHHGHFLFGEHWSDGRMRVALIDHAAGFRKEASVLMDHENAFQTGPVRCVSAHTYLRLRFLDRAMVEEKFKGMLAPEEISGLMERKEQVLAYLDQLVQERGYHRTVVE